MPADGKGDAEGRVVPATFLHDLNNLLTAIHGYSSLLAADLPAGGQEQDFAARILAAAEEARQLVAKVPRTRPVSTLRVLLVGGALARLAGALETLGLEVTLAASAREAQGALKASTSDWDVVAGSAESLSGLGVLGLPLAAVPAGADAVTVDALIRAARG
ncbi:hypothetical protein UAJ10_11535 [Nitrospirillum sp. BR 11164]|uniref:hypothetical protein n=1 Tax=Nitrospirillum sp. BR 11164 TaxID=3104324 RepID=UPI002B001B32|nr:hypothetical protein [Nitrospirillum sp. BR 11164]MEA1649642.1 hypothetical protein [Nitrospirillum sp. BR 11164]